MNHRQTENVTSRTPKLSNGERGHRHKTEKEQRFLHIKMLCYAWQLEDQWRSTESEAAQGRRVCADRTQHHMAQFKSAKDKGTTRLETFG